MESLCKNSSYSYRSWYIAESDTFVAQIFLHGYSLNNVISKFPICYLLCQTSNTVFMVVLKSMLKAYVHVVVIHFVVRGPHSKEAILCVVGWTNFLLPCSLFTRVILVLIMSYYCGLFSRAKFDDRELIFLVTNFSYVSWKIACNRLAPWLNNHWSFWFKKKVSLSII